MTPRGSADAKAAHADTFVCNWRQYGWPQYKAVPLYARSLAAPVLACLLSAPSTAARSEDSVRNFVERVNHASTTLLASESGATQKCRSLLAWAFDVPAMAQYALGTAWNKATSTERRAFLTVFQDEIVAAYVRRMRAYRGATMAFAAARSPTDGDRIAASHLIVPGGPEQTCTPETAIRGRDVAHCRCDSRRPQRTPCRAPRIRGNSGSQSWRHQCGDRLCPQGAQDE